MSQHPRRFWLVCDRAAGHWPLVPVPVASSNSSSAASSYMPHATCHCYHSSSYSYYQLLATTYYSSSCGYCARAAAAAYLGTTKNLLPIAHCPLPSIAYCLLPIACCMRRIQGHHPRYLRLCLSSHHHPSDHLVLLYSTERVPSL
jgi:hypothetical protein